MGVYQHHICELWSICPPVNKRKLFADTNSFLYCTETLFVCRRHGPRFYGDESVLYLTFVISVPSFPTLCLRTTAGSPWSRRQRRCRYADAAACQICHFLWLTKWMNVASDRDCDVGNRTLTNNECSGSASLKGLYGVRKTRLLSTRNSATPIHRLWVVLQLCPIHLSGAIFGRDQPCFSNSVQTL